MAMMAAAARLQRRMGRESSRAGSRPGAVLHCGCDPESMPLTRTPVLVADDHPVFRDGLVRVLKARPEFEIVGETGDGREALAEIRRLEPAVALLDVKMPGLDGPAIAHALRRDGVPTRVALISAHAA